MLSGQDIYMVIRLDNVNIRVCILSGQENIKLCGQEEEK